MQKLAFLLIAFAVFAAAFSAPTMFLPNNRRQAVQQLHTNPYDYLPRDQQEAIVQTLSRGFFAGTQKEEQAQEQFWGMLASALLPYAVDAIRDGK